MSRFMSVFAAKLDAMLVFRVARGFSEKTHLQSLLRFDKFCTERYPQAHELTPEIVYSWIDTVTTANAQMTYARAMREFGKYLNAMGEEAYVIPEKFATNHSGYVPYVFRDGELTALFSAIDKLPNNKNHPFLNIVAPVLFRLIYTCGLRPNEGRCLLCENVNLDTGEVIIIKTKRKKDRIVVMSDDMLDMCRNYDSRRRVFGINNPYFFPSNSGGTYTNGMILATLNKAWTIAVCSPQNPIPCRIRVYDLRHRFASACLNRWLDEGLDIMVMLPYLREYMGHSTMNETAYYIHILPENLTKSSAVDWKVFDDMFPEVIVQ